MKSQANVINIAGAGISTGLILLSYFLPSRSTFFKAIADGPKKVSVIQTRKVTISNTQLTPQDTCKTSPPTLTTQPSTLNQKQEQATTLESQKQKTKPKQSADKSEDSSKPNVCPKNLDYYTKKPRPKQTPEECITCKNLITCVCLTDNQPSS